MGDEQSGRMGGDLAQIGSIITGLGRVDSQTPIAILRTRLFQGQGEPRVSHKGIFSYCQEVQHSIPLTKPRYLKWCTFWPFRMLKQAKIGEEFVHKLYLQVLKIVYLTIKNSCRSYGTLESAVVSSEKMRAWRPQGAGRVLFVLRVGRGGRRGVLHPEILILAKAEVFYISSTACRICSTWKMRRHFL